MEDRLFGAPDSAALQQKIKELITTGEFEMGGKISEDQLATRFGAGRATIRHALASLAAIGLLDVRPRVGTFVFSLDVEEFDELNTLRAVLECAAIRISMESNRRIFLQRMQENLEQASTLTFRSNHHFEYRMLDREFHRLPFVCARNKYLTEAYENIEVKIWTMRSLLTFPDAHYNASLESHRSVVERLIDGNVELACERLQKHIKTSFSPREKNLLRSFDG